jgi:predicted dehydrogenase
MNRVPGVGVVGAGLVGRMRARVVSRSSGARLGAMADVDEARARKAGQPGVAIFTDYRRLLEETDVDAVIISTPAHLHEEMVLAALDRGKHVLCEKPLSTDVASCRRVVDRARKTGMKLAVGFNHRYYPCVKFLKRIIDEGTIGTIDHIRAFGGHVGLTEFRAEWMYQANKSGGGAMMDVGIHVTDLVRFLVGEVTEVVGVCTNRIWNVPGSEDDALAIMRTAAGIPVRYQATWSEWKGYRLWIEAYGHNGMAGAYYAPMTNLLVIRDTAGSKRTRRVFLHPWINVREKIAGWQTTAERAFAEEFDDFIRLVSGQENGRIADGVAGLRAVQIAHAVYQSSKTGAPVPVENVEI